MACGYRQADVHRRCRDKHTGEVRTGRNGPLVKRLRRRPLTPQTWVRFPYGSPLKNKLRTVHFRLTPKVHLSFVYFFVPNRKRFAGLRFGSRPSGGRVEDKKFLTVRRKFDRILAVEKGGKERKRFEVFFAYFLFQKKVSWC